jgi:lysophospholipase L1-like esterase
VKARPSPSAPPPKAAARQWEAALEHGRDQAQAVLDRRRAVAARRRRSGTRAARGSAGLLLAEGDSWFDYPFFDVLEELEEGFGYTVESVAHKGDTVEEMTYDANQLDKLARRLEKLRREKAVPKAVLLSGGGNDIAGEEFGVLLNHRRSSLPPLNEGVVAGLIDERLRAAIVELASAVTHLCRQCLNATLPIVIHGYDYPVPDGRGYLGGFWILPGPWLAPGFRKKGYPDRELQLRCDLMTTLIDRFNALLKGIAGGPGLGHLHYVDLRGTLSRDLAGQAYKAWWNDELHPSEPGFARIAGRFDQLIRRIS